MNAILFDRKAAASFRTAMKFLPAFTFLLIGTPLCACLWDRDTIAMEAQGRLEVVETMTGWFDRFPAEYYQMRLDRVTKEVDTTPERLDLYDDAAVSCDRLGRHDDAVAWMDKKSARMASLPQEQTIDHRYRMHANLGVFRTHQWIQTAERNTHREKLKLAIEEVSTALMINPNAHFGRERAHLALLEWWLAGLDSQPVHEPVHHPSQLLSPVLGDFPGTYNISNANLVKGFCGLIQMGSAQDSIDVHFLVMWQLMNDRTPQGHSDAHYPLGYLTGMRLVELIMADRQPVYAGEDFKRWLQPETQMKNLPAQMSPQEKLDQLPALLTRVNMWGGSGDHLLAIQPWFHQIRAAAQQRLEAKTAFMKHRFAAGMHPDTHPDFWLGWQEPVMPAVPHTKLEQIFGTSLAVWIEDERYFKVLLGMLAIGGVVSIYVIQLLLRRKRAKRQMPEA